MVLHYIGYQEKTGYGISGSLLVGAFKRLGITVYTTLVGSGDPDKGGHIVSGEMPADSSLEFDAVIVHTFPQLFPYWYAVEKVRSPKATIWGYTTWETDKVDAAWVPLMNTMDALFVPCEMNKAVFEKDGVLKPIFLLPHLSQFNGLAERPLSAAVQAVFDKFSGCYIFYYIGTWTERKVPWLVMQAFNEEFRPDEPVALILKTGVQDWVRYQRTWKTFFRKGISYSADSFKRYNRGSKNKIIHLTKELSDEDIAGLHSLVDCFISLTRGEGWGVTSYEAAWFGKPVIIPGFGGMMDYLSPATAYLVDYKLVPVVIEAYPDYQAGNQQWADPSVADARKKMREVFSNQQEARLRGELLKRDVQERFHADRIVQNCVRVLMTHNFNSII